MSDTAGQPQVKHKTFQFRTKMEWAGGRGGNSSAEGKPTFRVASPPEFKGEAGVWSPEDLLIQALNACTMSTFISFATKKNLPLQSYSSEAVGTLEFVDTSFQFTKLDVDVTMRLGPGGTEADAQKILHDAHKACLISNSLKGKVTVRGRVVP
ncbi:MAG TPA: OsmC family protein [Candidatus Thermoplasmatota archaeon]